jgi:hypothetical protein
MQTPENPPNARVVNDLDGEPNEFTIVFDGKSFKYPERTPELSVIKGGATVHLVNNSAAPATLILVSAGLRVAVDARILADLSQSWISGLAALAENIPGSGGSKFARIKFPSHLATGVYNYSILAIGQGAIVTDPCVIIK